MPSKIDKAFIDNLQNFTDSLYSVVELMKENSKKEDVVNKMLSAMDSTKMNTISEDLKILIDISKTNNNRTQEILKEIKAAKKQKETGLFGKIEDKDNKRKIVSGIQTVALIAGAVLAIGLAFKIVGRVDILSVLALSLGIVIISKAFEEISKLKEITPKKTLMLGLSLMLMSTAILISSVIISKIQPLNPAQMFSFIAISAGLGTALYFIAKALPSVHLKDVSKYFLLPFILPLLAKAIAVSSGFLKGTQPITLSVALAVAMTGLALGAAAFGIGFVLKGLGGKDGNIDTKKILAGLAIIPGLALGIVAASFILKSFQPIKNPIQLLLGSVVMGLSILAFVPAVYILGKLSLKQLLIGSLAILTVSVAMSAASWILSQGNYSEAYPNILWSLGVGLALILFSPAVWILGHLDIKSMLVGSLAIIVVSAAMMVSSLILSVGKYDNHPNLGWALGVGLSLILFSPAVIVLGLVAMTGIGALGILAGSAMVVIVSAAIVATSMILNKGNYDKYPNLEWATGVSLLTIAFGAGMLFLGLIPFGGKIMTWGKERMLIVASAIKETADILNKGNFSGGPTIGWAASVSLLTVSYGANMLLMGLIPFGNKIFNSGKERMLIVAEAIKESAEILSKGNYTGGPTLEWSNGVATSINAFSQALAISMKASGNFDGKGFSEFIKVVAQGMVSAADELSKGKWNVSAPSPEWGEGVSASLSPFIKAFEIIGNNKKLVKDLLSSGEDNSFAKLMRGIAHAMVDVSNILADGVWKGGPDQDWSASISASINAFTDSVSKLDDKKIDVIHNFSKAIKRLSNSISDLNVSGIDKLSNLTASVTIMSAVDQNNLNKVLNVLNDSKEKLGDVLNDVNRNPNQTDQIGRQPLTQVSKVEKTVEDVKDTPEGKILEAINTTNDKLDQLLDYIVSGKGAENFNKSDTTKK